MRTMTMAAATAQWAADGEDNEFDGDGMTGDGVTGDYGNDDDYGDGRQ